jgi:hypothetical protein
MTEMRERLPTPAMLMQPCSSSCEHKRKVRAAEFIDLSHTWDTPISTYTQVSSAARRRAANDDMNALGPMERAENVATVARSILKVALLSIFVSGLAANPIRIPVSKIR